MSSVSSYRVSKSSETDNEGDSWREWDKDIVRIIEGELNPTWE